MTFLLYPPAPSRILSLSQSASDNIDTSSNNNHRLLIRDNIRLPKLTFPDRVEEENNEMQECDIAFFDCVTQEVCSSCFFEMSTNMVDWAHVTQDTECSTVISTLQKNNFCSDLTSANQATFCNTFHSCVIFDDSSKTNKNRTVDCDTLTSCKWPGMHPAFIGDGVCHESYFDSCYNTAICKYDGGDCCKDTCKDGTYTRCRSDGYACRDPKSPECDPTFSLECPPSSYKKTSENKTVPIPTCQSDETLYRLVMYDSFCDGWEQTEMTITPQTSSTIVFQGGLKSGAEGTVYICLSVNPTCYNVKVMGGNWGREASWYIKGYSDGAPSIAAGGGAMDCNFPIVGSTSCTNTCTGKSNIDPTSDPDYKDFKNMNKCIDEKCIIQMSECQKDPTCQGCFVDVVQDYCFAVSTFLAVNDCAMCKCSLNEDDAEGITAYCNSKQAPGIIIPTPRDGAQPAKPVPCTPAETLGGTTALLSYSKCLNFDKTPLMMTDFDSNNFGHLDDFEACAHAFAATPDHGGRSALGCMKILVDAMHEDAKDGEPTALISQLATLLYSDGIKFCDCAKDASVEAPLCPSFYNFKTLLYESLDACTALDEIDCKAWDEFQRPCQLNIKIKYGAINFANSEQCGFVESNCGSADPLPSFRHFDCQREIPQDSWDFYNDYRNGCMNRAAPPLPTTTPTESGVPKTKSPTPYEPVNPDNIKPNRYAPTSNPTSDNNNNGQPSKSRPSYKSPDEKRKSHWFRNTILIMIGLGIVYYMYKKQSDGFNFVRYRRMTNFNSHNNNNGAFGMMDDDMYSGLSLESSSMTFEPPTLPPTPMSMPSHGGGYGA